MRFHHNNLGLVFSFRTKEKTIDVKIEFDWRIIPSIYKVYITLFLRSNKNISSYTYTLFSFARS